MQNHVAAIDTLLREAYRLPDSPPKLALLEEAVRLADCHQDVRLGIETRRSLMGTACSMIRGDVLAAAFSWSLAQYDRDPQLFGGRNLLSEYRWTIGKLSNILEVSRRTLEDMMADYARRLQTAGQSLARYHHIRCLIAPDLGDRQLALDASRELRRFTGLVIGPSDDLGVQIETELFVGNEEQALELARPFFEDVFKDHISKVDYTCTFLLVPLLKRGCVKLANQLLARCMRSYHPERFYNWPYGAMMKYVALSGDLPRALRFYAECQRGINPQTDQLTRLHFYLDAGVVFDRLTAAGVEQVPLRLSKEVPVPHDDGHYQVAQLRDWLGREARTLAERFDARNGTRYFTAQIQERAKLRQWAATPQTD